MKKSSWDYTCMMIHRLLALLGPRKYAIVFWGGHLDVDFFFLHWLCQIWMTWSVFSFFSFSNIFFLLDIFKIFKVRWCTLKINKVQCHCWLKNDGWNFNKIYTFISIYSIWNLNNNTFIIITMKPYFFLHIMSSYRYLSNQINLIFIS